MLPGVYANLSNGGVYSGVRTATMDISSITGLNNTDYRCIVSNSSCSITSVAAQLTVTSAPGITVQPAPASECRGSSAYFTITATGGNLSYQWQSSPNGTVYTNLANTGVYSGVTRDSLVLSSVTGLTNTRFRCIVSGTCTPAATSEAAILTVSTAPVISRQPASVSECTGTAVSFSVTATVTGGTLTYQWQSNVSGSYANLSNTGVFSNVTTNTMNISDITGLNNTDYRCIVNNASCSITSSAALLTVNTAPDITTQPFSLTMCSNNAVDFSLTVSGSSLSYQWQLSNTGTTYTNMINTGVYTGTTTDTLKISSVAGLNGRHYRCLVSGICSPVATSNAAILTVNVTPVINTQPVSESACNGQGVTFSLVTSGGTFSYQWQSNVSGAFQNMNNNAIDSNVTTPSLRISNVTGLNNTDYRCVVSNSSCNVTSDETLLTVNTAPSIVLQPSPATICGGSGTYFSVKAAGSELSYQWQFSVTGTQYQNLSNTGVYSGSTSDSLDISSVTGLNNYRYRCLVSGVCTPKVVTNPVILSVSVAPVISSQPQNSVECAGDSVQFFVSATGNNLTYQWQSDISGTFENLDNGGIYSNVTTTNLSIYDVTGLNNSNYLCVVNNGSCSIKTNSASLTVLSAPVINLQPLNITQCSGNSAMFYVLASGNNLSYQWQINDGINITNLSNTGVYSGATSDTLNISNVTGLNNMQYLCIVSGTCPPAATSNFALLTVIAAPVISAQPASETKCSASTASFAVKATGTALSYQWQSNVSGTFKNLINGGIYSNVTTATMDISNVTGLNNTDYLCVISNASCGITSETATLSVTTPPLITIQPQPEGACTGNGVTFSLTATGGNLSYQWQSSPNGTVFTNIANTGVYSRATNDSLEISNVTGLNNLRYRCIVNNSCSPTATSNAVVLTVSAAPTISNEPASVSECTGSGASFSVTATGGNYSYQWQSNASGSFENLANAGIYSNVTTATMSISSVNGLNNTVYRCIISNASCNVTSSTAILTVNITPTITSQPVTLSACTGNSADFSVTATGTNLSYQWQLSTNGTTYANMINTGVYSGTTTDSLGISSVTGLNGRRYRCIVSGNCLLLLLLLQEF